MIRVRPQNEVFEFRGPHKMACKALMKNIINRIDKYHMVIINPINNLKLVGLNSCISHF
jgi:hypothetical protein